MNEEEEKELVEEFKQQKKKEQEEREKPIVWTSAQEEVIGRMIRESEDIGWTQGWDDANKEIIKEIESFLFNLKSKIYRRENDH